MPGQRLSHELAHTWVKESHLTWAKLHSVGANRSTTCPLALAVKERFPNSWVAMGRQSVWVKPYGQEMKRYRVSVQGTEISQMFDDLKWGQLEKMLPAMVTLVLEPPDAPLPVIDIYPTVSD